ncbi:hypothetical protein MTO96_002948 [Rhipicephalus appendiculatus]
MAMDFCKLPEFAPSSGSFDVFVERFELYATVNEIAEAKKPHLFLSAIGDEAYVTIPSLLLRRTPSTSSYQEVVSALKKHYSPRRRFSHFVLHITSWVLVIFPVVGCGLLACLSVMYFAIVRQHDAEEDENARLEILKIIEKQSQSLGTLTPAERLVIVAFTLAVTLWCAVHVIAFFTKDGRFDIFSDHDTLALDYLLVALLSSAACQGPVGRMEARATACGPSSAVDWRTMVANILWGPLIVHGSVSCVGRALQVSGATYWIQAVLSEFNLFPPSTIQIVLTVLSCVLTEFVSIDVTVATLLPIVALMVPCNPLYFAIPVAVASSTTLVLPTSAMSIAILDDVLTPCRRKMVVTLSSLILSMNTVGDMLFSWSELPSWAQQQPAPNASSVVAIRRLPLGTLKRSPDACAVA